MTYRNRDTETNSQSEIKQCNHAWHFNVPISFVPERRGCGTEQALIRFQAKLHLIRYAAGMDSQNSYSQ